MSIEKNIHNVGVALGIESGVVKDDDSLVPLSPGWFHEKGKAFINLDNKAKEIYEVFSNKYGPAAISNLNGEELLKRLFLCSDNESMCHEIEYAPLNTELFGSIKGGTVFKYPLHYDQDKQSWVTGTVKHSVDLSLEDAIKIGEEVKNVILKTSMMVSQLSPLNTVEKYLDLYNEFYTLKSKYIDGIWFLKYLHMICPAQFPTFYSESWQLMVLNSIKEAPSSSLYGRIGQIMVFIKKCDISAVVFNKVFGEYISHHKLEDFEEDVDFDFSSSKIKDGQNLIVYGTPGCGKSYFVQHTLLKDYKEENYIRTTFFQDYTNTDFVGQILPVVNEDRSVEYKFNPGPFTLALEKAIRNPDEKVALVIEELNRGSAASIFGDIFQLLDRKDGVSEYSITNINIIKYLEEQFNGKYAFDCIKLPSNLSIFATMNTSDQNVFTLDTAFKRRWKFKKLANKFNSEHTFKDKFVPGANITWEDMVDEINGYILDNNDGLNNEDKQIGVYFVDGKGMRDTKESKADDKDIEEFAYKVLEYLWDDVAKFQRDRWFDDEIKSLDDLVEKFKEKGLGVFKDGVFNK